MSESVQGAFNAPLDDELAQVASERVNALPSVVAERFAALRWALERANRKHCDGFATDATPGVAAGSPVEVKACRVHHQSPGGGTCEGRFSVHVDSHEELAGEGENEELADGGGHYAIVVYDTVEVEGVDRVVVLGAALVDAVGIGRLLPASCRAKYQKIRWSRVLELDADDVGWSE